MKKRKLVMIGNGMAGVRTIEEILARGGAAQFDITVLGDEPYGNYNRILLSEVLNGSQDASEIFLNPLAWYRENGIQLHAGVRAQAVHRHSRQVTGEHGIVEPYDNLIIATGSSPYIPPIQGVRLDGGELKPGVFVFRSLDDCNRIAEYTRGKRSAAVIGGGLLGLEAARGLQNFGLDVHVVHISGHLMGQQLDATAGAILRTTLEQLGVKVHLNRSTKEVLGEDHVTGLRFADGETLDCDLVVISAGIRPNVDLALRAGLTVERGILVDNHMRTPDDPRIYAVGECVQHRGHVYGLVAPLWEQGKVLADHITGHNARSTYSGSKVATKLKVMGVQLASMGITEPTDERDEIVQFLEPRKGTYKKLIIRDGRLVGGILLGDVSKAAYLIQAFDKDTPLPEERLSLLFDIGAPSGKTTLEEMPPEMQVCNCNGVSKEDLVACVRSGERSLRTIMDATRAGMGCGACKGLVSEVVAWACGGAAEQDPSASYYVPGVPLSKPELVQAILERGLRSVSAVFRELAGGKEDPGSKPGLASLLRILWHHEYEDERDARFINDRVHGNIQKDGTFSVIPQIPGGVTSAAQLRRIADVVDRYHVPLVKLTGGQRIDLLGVKKEDLPSVWRDLDMPSGFAYGKSYRTCKSCVGTDFCRFGLGDSIDLAVKIERHFQGMETPAKLKLATAGCPRNCSEAMVKDVGAVAVEGGKWEIHVGGAAGAHVRKGDVLCVVDSHEEVLTLMGRFIQYYRENARYLERTYGFVERVGIQKIRAVVVDDSEGIAARLDEEMKKTTEAYRDPWREAYSPATPNQFRSVLPIVQ
ncbi:nitrite reductase [Sorangium cellulosum]|uniref:Nitrite reductase n=1 Tax=Sorangium cellulosum TaxID=56 RepID=A0A2L0EU45_SORCE|nr:nitrite reductase large subunit NirB [Sorangium cellulosum]AUX42805.1 nitrite reductase [Sorangium cellulosum]